MPVYAQLAPFMGLVKNANRTFERVRSSSLRPLINTLKSATGTALDVRNHAAALTMAKTKKYIDALYFLFATYPGLATYAGVLKTGFENTTEAVEYPQTAVPGNFHPYDQHARNQVFIVPASVRTGMTLEQYILVNASTTSVELIHLTGDQPGMERMFAGKSCLNHIKSVLQVANWMGCPVCCLTMDPNSDVTGALQTTYNASHPRTRALVQNGHMGTIDAGLTAFVALRANLVVMGFDGSVCVFANVFGGNEHMVPPTPLNPHPPFRPPLVSLANVIMSRAGIVSNGPLFAQASSSFGAAEYGYLSGKG